MNSCKNFSKNHPVLLVVLTLIFVFGILKLTNLLPNGPMAFGTREFIMAVLVFSVTLLFMGKEKVRFTTDGFGYTFRSLRGYFIVN